MAGFSIVLIMLVMTTIGIGMTILIPLIVSVISIPKDSLGRLKKIMLFWISMLGVQIVTLGITIIMAVPIGLVIPFESWTTDDIGPLAVVVSLVFKIVPIILLMLFSIFAYKWITKIKTKTNKLTFIAIMIQSILLSFGIKVVGFAVVAIWMQ